MRCKQALCPTQGQSVSEDTQEAKEFPRSVCETAECGGNFLVAREAKEADRGVSEGGQILRGVATAHLALVLAKRDVADPVEPVFDRPVAPPITKQLVRICFLARQTRDGVLDLHRLDAFADGGAFQAADLGQTRPVKMVCQPRAGLEVPLSVAAVAFFGRACFRERLLALGFACRGKNPAGNRPQWLPSVPADCL